MSIHIFAFAFFALLAGIPVLGLVMSRNEPGSHGKTRTSAMKKPRNKTAAGGIPLRFAGGFPKQTRSDYLKMKTIADTNALKKRIIIWDGDVSYPDGHKDWMSLEKAGLVDRLYCITHLLALATKVGAFLSIREPDLLLGEHPVEAPPWWDQYIYTVPKLYRVDELSCDPDVPVTILKRGDAFDPSMIELDTDRPLCLQIATNYWHINWDKARELMDSGGELLTFQTSQLAMNLVDRAQTFLAAKSGTASRFNAVHVRQGDRGAFDCMTPRNVVAKMIGITDRSLKEKGDQAASTWFVMTLANQAWFDDLSSNASTVGIQTFTEAQVPVIAEQQDNMMRYLIGNCLWNYAALGLYTWMKPALHCEGRGFEKTMVGTLDCPPPARDR